MKYKVNDEILIRATIDYIDDKTQSYTVKIPQDTPYWLCEEAIITESELKKAWELELADKIEKIAEKH